MSQSFQSVCIILLVNFIFYWKTIYFGYVSDDLAAATRNYPANIWHHIYWILEGKLKTIRKGKHYPQIDHALTLVFHSLVCVGIFLGFGANSVSFVAALLFSVNPMNNQVSVWIAGRSYAIAALGMVWALALPMEMGGLMLLGATYSNAGFLMPLVLIGSSRPELFIFAPIVWWFNWGNFYKNVSAKMKIETFTEDKKLKPQKITLAIKTFGFYLSHSFFPIKNTFYHSLLESIAGSRSHRAYSLCRFFWIGAVSLILMGWYVLTHKWDMGCFGILWWCVGIGPFLNLRRLQQEIAERYAYLPNIGLMLILAQFIYTSPYLIGFFIAMYATKMWFWMDAYKDDFWIIETSRVNSPDSWFGWHMAAVKRFEKQSYMEATIFWAQAKLISPKEFKLLYNLGVCSYLVFKNINESNQLMKEAEDNIPRGQEVMGKQLIMNFKNALKDPQAKIPILI